MVLKVLEPMTSPGRTRSEATESDRHRVVLVARGQVEHVREVSPGVSLAFVPGHVAEATLLLISQLQRDRRTRTFM